MELQEVQAYKKRQEERLAEFLSYEQGIKKQIEIEELIVSKIPDKDKEIIKLLIMVAELNKKIREFGQTDIKETKQEMMDKIKDIKAFKSRLETEYEDTLQLRGGIIKQTAEDEKKLQEFQMESQKKREQVLSEIAEDIKKAEQSLFEVKTEKDDFVKSLESRKSELEKQSEEIGQKEKQVADDLAESILLNSQLDGKAHLLIAEKELLEREGKLTEEKKRELNFQIITLNKNIHDNLESVKTLEIKSAEIDKEEENLAKQKIELELKEESIQKTLQTFTEREASIDKDRLKLESQNETLKLAFQELKNREAKIDANND